VQQSFDPTTVSLMCPWPECGGLSPVAKSYAPELVGRTLNCRFCGLPSTVPANVMEE
jgi:hypothetical protein